MTLFCISFAYAGWEPRATDKSPLYGAVLAYKKGDYAVALKACQWHRSDANTGPEARLLAGMCMFKAGSTGGALREWKSVRDSWPTVPEAVAALTLEIENTSNAAARAKLEDTLLTTYAGSPEAKDLLDSREKADATEAAKLTPESELDELLEAGKRDEAAKFLIAAARRASGEERDRHLAQLATLYESTGDWRKAAGAWRKIVDEGNAEFREAATFDWIRTTAAIGRNANGVEAMWKDFLRDYPASTYSHLAVTRLAEMMISQKREPEAEALLDGWLKAAEGKSAATDLVSNHLAHLRQQQEAEKEDPQTAFAKDRQEAFAKLPAELETLCALAKSGKGSGKILNRIRDIRRSLANSEIAPALLLRIDLAEALALNGLGESRKALGLFDDAWNGNHLPHVTKDSSHEMAFAELSIEAIGIAVESGEYRAAVVWAERIAGAVTADDNAAVAKLKETALLLLLADAMEAGGAVLTILGDHVLARLPEDSRLRKEETAAVCRLKALCANGKAIPDNEWFVGELPLVRDSRISRELFRADLLFAARETEKASRAYSGVILKAGLDTETEAYATLQMARSLAAIGDHEQALRTYRRFESSLAETQSAAPALLRAGTLCAGPMNDSKTAISLFLTVSTRYPASPEAELCDWYAATLLLWEGDLRASRAAFDEFEKRHPQSPFITALNDSIRPQL